MRPTPSLAERLYSSVSASRCTHLNCAIAPASTSFTSRSKAAAFVARFEPHVEFVSTSRAVLSALDKDGEDHHPHRLRLPTRHTRAGYNHYVVLCLWHGAEMHARWDWFRALDNFYATTEGQDYVLPLLDKPPLV